MKRNHIKQLIFSLLLFFSLVACSLSSIVSSAGSTVGTLVATNSGSSTTQSSSGGTQHGTVAEAKTMLQKAVEHYKLVGRKQALSDFTGRVSPFYIGDLYVACIDSHLTQSANGGYPYLVGSTVEPISRAAWDAATINKVDSVSYQWLDPANGQTEPKTFFYEKVGTDVCGVGAYNP
jgi:hypothetical protein